MSIVIRDYDEGWRSYAHDDRDIKHTNRRSGTKGMTRWKKVSVHYTISRLEGWLLSSIQSKVDHHIRIINKYLQALPPGKTTLKLELARFDVARIIDPTIHGEMYQQGPMYDYENVRAYVFSRDHYQCCLCGMKGATIRADDGSTVKLHAHHIDFRSKGTTDNLDHMITVCTHCHTPGAHQAGGKLYAMMRNGVAIARGYRDETFMILLSGK